jgi:hypothetical protein
LQTTELANNELAETELADIELTNSSLPITIFFCKLGIDTCVGRPAWYRKFRWKASRVSTSSVSTGSESASLISAISVSASLVVGKLGLGKFGGRQARWPTSSATKIQTICESGELVNYDQVGED